MTFSICVREEYVDDGDEHVRFGVAVTTRLPGVGAICPYASEHGAIATQSFTNPELGHKGLDYLADGLSVDDALRGLLNADDEREKRQVHGVSRDASIAFSGEECRDWYGHHEGDAVTVAGNLLAGEAVVDATVRSYETSDREEPLAKRLIDALAAGDAEGGDAREDLPVQSAALVVASSEDQEFEPYYNDLRVDATETPMRALRETFHEAERGYEMALEKYGAAEEAGEAGEVDGTGEADEE